MIAKHPLFEFLSLLVLIFNCITILIDNSSLTGGPLTTLPILVKLDNFFFFFYIFELTIKVVALGFIMNNGAYLSSGWNILDFFIISTAIINKVTFEYGINLKSLRSLRVLRPLKILASLKKLQIILESLFSALPLLADSFLFLTFCYLLYALAGLQLFPGLLKKRCIYSITGLINPLDVLCGNVGCEQNQICSKLLKNPNYGLMSFDNLFYSFLNVFQIVTVDNWTSIMYSVQKTFSNYASIYFLSLVIIGGLFLVNLTLAIIKVKFSNLKNFEKKIKHTQKIYDFLLLKEKKIWIPSHNSNFYGLGSINKKIIKTVDNDSAKSMKKNRIPRNIFSSDHLLSHLKSEIYKLTDGITSHVSEIGKAPDQIGKSAGIDKLNKVINKFSLFKKNKRISFEINDDDNKNEDLNKKYLKLQICSFKNYESTSTYEVKENSNISEKILRRHVTTFKNFSKSKITKKFRKKKGKFLINYHLPNHVKPEENINFFLKIPLIKKQTLSLQRPNIVNSLDMIPKIDKKSIKGEQNIIFTAIEKFNYEETRKKISENIKDMVEFREQLEQCFFNNEYIFVELFVSFFLLFLKKIF